MELNARKCAVFRTFPLIPCVPRSLFIVLLMALSAPSSSLHDRGAAPGVLVIDRVTVIDATGAPAQPGMTVVIEGDRISAIGKSGTLAVDAGARVVDARGKYLIPGLWDVHVHNSYRSFLPLLLANGVTGVRDMGGSPAEFDRLKEWLGEIGSGSLPGPRVIAAGVIVDGPAGKGRPDSMHVSTAAEAREAVGELAARGADFIKVYTLLPREAYFAIADETKRRGMIFAGHVPADISAVEASDAGQQTLEHLFGVLPLCSRKEAELLGRMRASIAGSPTPVFISEELRAQALAIDSYDRRKAAALFARFARNGTWQSPTLVGFRNLADAPSAAFDRDVRLKYIPVERRESWVRQRAYLQKHIAPEYWANRHRLLKKQLEMVGAMHRAGVGILAGTDTASFYVYPGFSLHDELGMLVNAGLTPMEALQAATRNPARYLGKTDSFGTIERGKIADLVLLDASPLKDIGNTKRIAAVVAGGKLLDRAELDRMLAGIEAEAGVKR